MSQNALPWALGNIASVRPMYILAEMASCHDRIQLYWPVIENVGKCKEEYPGTLEMGG